MEVKYGRGIPLKEEDAIRRIFFVNETTLPEDDNSRLSGPYDFNGLRMANGMHESRIRRMQGNIDVDDFPFIFYSLPKLD